MIIRILVVILFFFSFCSNKKKSYLNAWRSEGLTTTTIELFSDSSFTVTDKTFLSKDENNGNYSISDSIITLNSISGNGLIKSSKLLMKKEIQLIFYQLNKENKIDTTLPKLFVVDQIHK